MELKNLGADPAGFALRKQETEQAYAAWEAAYPARRKAQLTYMREKIAGSSALELLKLVDDEWQDDGATLPEVREAITDRIVELEKL